MPTALVLLCSRRDLDPRLGARGSGRIVRVGARAVVPIRLRRLRRLLVYDDWRRLYNDLRRIVVGRVIPPRAAPTATGSDHDHAVSMKGAVEPVVPMETVAT